MTALLSVDEIRRRLEHRVNKKVAECTGICEKTVSDIKLGKQKNPCADTIEKLTVYFEENP